MWDLPGPRLEPVSLALASGFLTTEPPGKSQVELFNQQRTEDDHSPTTLLIKSQTDQYFSTIYGIPLPTVSFPL